MAASRPSGSAAMMGFAILAVVALLALALLRLMGLRGAMFTLAAAVIAIGGAGYALQGRPTLRGATAETQARVPPIPLTKARKALMGQFDAADTWLTISEGYAARGKSQDAVGVLRSAIRERPTNYALWVGLGNALSDHGRGLNPAARFAFAKASELAPGHPAPTFFLGLALARSGEPEQGIALWRELLAAAPADASWRPMVEDALIAISAGAPTAKIAPTRDSPIKRD